MTRRILVSLRDTSKIEDGEGVLFRYRPLGIPPAAQRKVATAALEEDWRGRGARLYNPHVDMVTHHVHRWVVQPRSPGAPILRHDRRMALSNMKREGGKGLVLVPALEGATSMKTLRKMSKRVMILHKPVREMFAGRRKLKPLWGLAVAGVGLRHS